jgi:hypothetical protein
MRHDRRAAVLLPIILACLPGLMATTQGADAEDVQRIKDEAVYKGFLALQPNESYPTRKEASDPRTWKPVKFKRSLQRMV